MKLCHISNEMEGEIITVERRICCWQIVEMLVTQSEIERNAAAVGKCRKSFFVVWKYFHSRRTLT